MKERGSDESGNQENRKVFSEHRQRGGRPRGSRPNEGAGFKRAQEAISRDRPDRSNTWLLENL